MIKAIRIHIEGIKIALASRMAYRGDFIISFIIMLLVEHLAPLVTILIYKNGSSFPGWDMYEVLLVQGVFMLSRGISFPFFFGMVWNTIGRVQEGTFDLLLIKPSSVLFMTIVTGFDSEDLGKLMGGIAMFTIALKHVPAIDALQWIQFIILFSVSLVIMFAFGLFMAGIGIVWIGNFRVYDIFFSISNFGMYPKSIFSKAFQSVFTMLIPVFLLGFFPASVLLGNPDSTAIYAILSSVGFLAVALLFYKSMVSKYTSAGG